MSRGQRLVVPLLGAAWLASFGADARADWLVLHDGTRFEVNGAWKFSGKQVVFTARDGMLSSLRANQVDLEASDRATAESLQAAEPKPAATPPIFDARPKVHWSLSDKDFARRTSAATDDSGQAPAAENGNGEPAPPPAPKSDLKILVWSHCAEPDRNRIKVSGTLQNGGKDLATSIALKIQLLDRQGFVVGTQRAQIQKASLAAGEAMDFVALFPGAVTYETVRFAPDADHG